jgi:hypothetical protein
MNKTAKNTKDAKEFTPDFRLSWRAWRLGGFMFCLVLLAKSREGAEDRGNA